MKPQARGRARSSRRNISSLQRKAPALSESVAGTPADSQAASMSRRGSELKRASGAPSMTGRSTSCTPLLSAIRASRRLTATRSRLIRSAFALSPRATTASGWSSSSSGSIAAQVLPAPVPVTTGSVA